MQVQILNGVTAANGPPSGAAAGVPLNRDSRAMQFINTQLDGFYDNIDEVALLLKTAGGTASTISFIRAWGYFEVSKGPAGATTAPRGVEAADWFPLGIGTGANKGKLNGGAALDETKAGIILHTEKIRGLREPSRFYLEIGVVAGTPSTIDAWLEARGQAQP